MQSAVVFLLACLPLIALGQQPPCGNRACPSYTRTQNQPGSYEVRSYDPSRWVVTDCNVPGSCFMRLFWYIGGANDQSAKIPMTVPVLKAKRASGTTMMFFIPNTLTPNTPVPVDTNVQLFDFPQKEFYVRVFTTNSKPSPAKYQQELQALKNAIGDATLYNTAVSYAAGYHSPWFPGERHNEVWLEKV